MRLPCGFLNHGRSQRDRPKQTASTGGRGRIRTFVARKERQIYSLLVLATHPPVPRKTKRTLNACPPKLFRAKSTRRKTKTQKGLVSKDTSPFIFPRRICSASLPLNLGGAGGGN